MRVLAVFGGLVLLSFGPAVAAPLNPGYELRPAEAWVDHSLQPRVDPWQGDSGNGVEYLLVDRQYRVETGWNAYSRTVFRPTNASGVSAQSQVSIEFDPSRERLVLHGITIRRGDRSIDQTKVARINLLRREQRLGDNILDGRLTLNVLLHDLRVGDVVDYSFTRVRRPDEWRAFFRATTATQFQVPVRDLRVRLTAPISRAVRWRATDGASPTTERDADWQVLVWRWKDRAALPAEDSQPTWYSHHPLLELSEFPDWASVAAAAYPMYRVPARIEGELAELVQRFRQAGPPAEQVVAVLRFVQDEVRYTGIAIGEGAYVATDPATVLARRYGDCKDKTLLAITLLRALGIEAVPALVSWERRRGVADRLPSPDAFDHVIVRLRVDGRTYWFDPTVMAQGGSLTTMAQADYGRALPLEPGATSLEILPEASALPWDVRAFATFDLSTAPDGEASVQVVTERAGRAADDFRISLQEQTTEQIGSSYLKYYGTRYPGIDSEQPLQIVDDRDANRIVVTERYRLPARTAGADPSLPFEVHADEIVTFLNNVAGTRSTPLAVTHPRRIEQRIHVRWPEDLAVTSENVQIRTAAFDYGARVEQPASREVVLTYTYRTTSDHVVPADTAAYDAERLRAIESSYFSLTPGAALSASGRWSLPAVAALAGGLSVGLVAVLLARRREYVWWRRGLLPPGPVGIGGWMILPSVGLVVLVPMLLYVVWTSRAFLDAGGYATLVNAEHAPMARWGASVVLVGFAGLGALLPLAAWTFVLWLQRSVSFPAVFIVLNALVLPWGIAFSTLALLAPDGYPLSRWYLESARDVVMTVVWTVYMLRSKRVRSTFTTAREPVRDDTVPRLVPTLSAAA